MRTTLSILCAGLALSVLLIEWSAGPALSGDKKEKKVNKGGIDPDGEPKKAGKGSPHFAVWHDQKSWHLRTMITPKTGAHRFRGVVRVDGGTFTKVQSYKLEKKGPLEDHWRLDEAGRQALAFDFKTKVVDGIAFQVSKTATAIYFDLGVDGQADPQRVVIGHKAAHPAGIPFSLPSHPDGKKGDGKKKKGDDKKA